MHPKLVWTQSLGTFLSNTLGSTVTVSIQDHVDPLKKLVVLQLSHELGKGDYNPIQKVVHAFSNANDCVVHRIRREPKKLILEVLTKTRRGEVMDKNPLLDEG